MFDVKPAAVDVVNEGGGGIDIVDLSKADNGQVRLVKRLTSDGKAKVKVTDDSRHGQTVTINLSGDSFDVEINGKKAKLRHCCFNASFTASLEDPPGCVEPIRRICR